MAYLFTCHDLALVQQFRGRIMAMRQGAPGKTEAAARHYYS